MSILSEEKINDALRGLPRYASEWDDADFHTFARAIGAAVLEAQAKQKPALHKDTSTLVDRFADAMREKLAKAEAKYGYSNLWLNSDWMDECRSKLVEHLHKGDPLDVANYCAFLWHHKEHCKPSIEQMPVACIKEIDEWLDQTGAIGKEGSWYHELIGIIERHYTAPVVQPHMVMVPKWLFDSLSADADKWREANPVGYIAAAEGK